jgi:hypothetical protein
MSTLKNLTVNDTGFLNIPKGTTAQRPGTPAAGMMRFNTDYNVNEYYNGTAWVSLSGAIAGASGGTQEGAVTIGGSKVATFTSGSSAFTPVYTGTVELLIVGGGGAGAGLGGGGGAGGVIYQAAYPVVAGVAIPLSIGAGGAPSGNTHGPSGASGTSSTFGALTAVGGGGGSGYSSGGAVFPGGSGGGGPGHGSVDGQRPAGEGVTGQGHPGGWGHHGGTGPASQLSPQPGICVYGGGGGGGAGEKGIPRHSVRADAKGGDGIASTIKGTIAQYFGGGGGGGGHGPAGNYTRASNTGGRGGGGSNPGGGPSASHNARDGTGGGGAGIIHDNGQPNGAGGSGIVVVRYKT